jgi:hypothetical protein
MELKVLHVNFILISGHGQTEDVSPNKESTKSYRDQHYQKEPNWSNFLCLFKTKVWQFSKNVWKEMKLVR